MAERMALNAPIQGSAADIIKLAMLGVHRALREAGCARGCCCRCTTSWCSRSRRRAGGARGAGAREMGGAYPLTVPLDVSVGVGRTWDDAGH
jgi:DNA polymerase-1